LATANCSAVRADVPTLVRFHASRCRFGGCPSPFVVLPKRWRSLHNEAVEAAFTQSPSDPNNPLNFHAACPTTAAGFISRIIAASNFCRVEFFAPSHTPEYVDRPCWSGGVKCQEICSTPGRSK